MKFNYSSSLKRSGLVKLSTALGFILLTTLFVNAAPTNDNFLNAQLLSGVNGTFSGTNVDATKQVGEPYHFGNLGGSSIWYKFVAPGNGVLHFATSNTNFDTVVAVYTGTSVGNLTLVGRNDNDELSGWMKIYSRVFVGTQTGQTYYLAVDGKNMIDGNGALEGQVSGNFSLENVVTNDNFGSAYTLATGSGTYSISTSNIGASKESGEPNHMNNSGGKSVWFNYSNDANFPRRITLNLDSSRAGEEDKNVMGLIMVYTGATLGTLNHILQGGSPFYGKTKITFLAAAHSSYRIAIDGYDSGTGADTGSFTLTYGISKDIRTADFDDDGKADVSIFRPSDGTFYSLDSGTNRMRAYRWGMNGDKPLVSKGSTSQSYYSVFRQDTGAWYVTTVTLDSYFAFLYGSSGDVALYNNFRRPNGGIESYPTVFHPTDGSWWTKADGGSVVQFGQLGDIPITADFDGDGTDEYVVFRPSNGYWYLLNVLTNQTQAVHFGQNGDIPVPADYNADGIADIAIFRPSTGDWWFWNPQTGAQTAKHFGQFGDEPQPADYDGDGKADLCVFRDGVWWIHNSSNGSAKAVNWGLFNDLPITAHN
jgi:hypothetical protein